MMIQETPEQEAITKKMYGLEYGSDAHIEVLKEYWDYTMKIYKGTIYEDILDPPTERRYECMRKYYANEKVHHVIK